MLKLSNSNEDQRMRNFSSLRVYATDREIEEVKPLIKIFIYLLLIAILIITFF